MHKFEKATAFKDIPDVLLRSRPAVRLINMITIYRIITFPVIIIFLLTGNIAPVKWLLLASFFTDAVDGLLARKFNATSILGAKLDSIGDDLTVLAAALGLLITKFLFVVQQWLLLCILFVLYLIQLSLALFKYGKISTFHTYTAKVAAVITAVFLMSAFFFDRVFYGLFYAAYLATAIDLVEEIILVILLPKDQSNVRGLYWMIRKKNH